jgi:hypothetical protein
MTLKARKTVAALRKANNIQRDEIETLRSRVQALETNESEQKNRAFREQQNIRADAAYRVDKAIDERNRALVALDNIRDAILVTAAERTFGIQTTSAHRVTAFFEMLHRGPSVVQSQDMATERILTPQRDTAEELRA